MFSWLLLGAALGCTFATALAWLWATAPPLTRWEALGVGVLAFFGWGATTLLTPVLTHLFWHWPASL